MAFDGRHRRFCLLLIKSNDLRLQILAQVHGHPGDWVGHSAGDNRGAFMAYEGYYSVVVPNYGLQGLLPLSRCGVHRFDKGRFVRLPAEDVSKQFVVAPAWVDLRRGP
jgi:hypothetical protein